MKRILVLGGTGLVGGEVLCALQEQRSDVQIVAPTRRPLLEAAGLENPVVDFDPLPTQEKWWKADAVICCLGSTLKQAGSRDAFRQQDLEMPLSVLALARRAGTPAAAIVSSIGADSGSSNFYLRTKGAFEDAASDLGFRSLSLVRPSIIAGPRQAFRPGERLGLLALKLTAPVVPRRYRPSPATDIARCLISAALADTPGLSIIESTDIGALSRRFSTINQV